MSSPTRRPSLRRRPRRLRPRPRARLSDYSNSLLLLLTVPEALGRIPHTMQQPGRLLLCCRSCERDVCAGRARLTMLSPAASYSASHPPSSPQHCLSCHSPHQISPPFLPPKTRRRRRPTVGRSVGGLACGGVATAITDCWGNFSGRQ